MAGGAALMAASVAVSVLALASGSFAPHPRQRAVIVPFGLAGVSGGSALLIVGARRHIRWLRWQDRASSIHPIVAPTRGGVAAGVTARF